MNLALERYLDQKPHLPPAGWHILAQFDTKSIVVYQAYSPAIGQCAVKHQHFGGPFKLDRMSWIKPNFLWMMYRSGWATKVDQEVVLAVRIRRDAFDSILSDAVASTFDPDVHSTQADWKLAVDQSNVRLQWDPDHDPRGRSELRRAIQLGLRGETLVLYSREWIIRIEDISEFVREQSKSARGDDWSKLVTPSERPYPVSSDLRLRLGMGELSGSA